MKIRFLFIALLSFNSFSAVERISCPQSIICNYQSGVCNYPKGWSLYSGEAKKYFNGAIRINFSEAGIYNGHLLCAYGYDYLNIYFFALTSVGEVIGINGIGWYWASAGFGKAYQSCASYSGAEACSVLIRS